MLHLHTERLAALVDEPASAEELAHLAQCSYCADERRSFIALRTISAAEQNAFGLPLTRWDAISAALDAEAPPRFQAPPVQQRRMPRGMQIAAGLLLVAGGATLGRMSARIVPASVAFSGDSTSRTVAMASADSTFFNGVDDARMRQQRAEMLYQQAAAYLARYDTTGATPPSSPVAYRSRLAALDQVISTTRAAMREAPHDPVINGYYLTTLGQREATLQQLNTVLPASLHVNSF